MAWKEWIAHDGNGDPNRARSTPASLACPVAGPRRAYLSAGKDEVVELNVVGREVDENDVVGVQVRDAGGGVALQDRPLHGARNEDARVRGRGREHFDAVHSFFSENGFFLLRRLLLVARKKIKFGRYPPKSHVRAATAGRGIYSECASSAGSAFRQSAPP